VAALVPYLDMGGKAAGALLSLGGCRVDLIASQLWGLGTKGKGQSWTSAGVSLGALYGRQTWGQGDFAGSSFTACSRE
jgi:hypothetical protein